MAIHWSKPYPSQGLVNPNLPGLTGLNDQGGPQTLFHKNENGRSLVFFAPNFRVHTDFTHPFLASDPSLKVEIKFWYLSYTICSWKAQNQNHSTSGISHLLNCTFFVQWLANMSYHSFTWFLHTQECLWNFGGAQFQVRTIKWKVHPNEMFFSWYCQLYFSHLNETKCLVMENFGIWPKTVAADKSLFHLSN